MTRPSTMGVDTMGYDDDHEMQAVVGQALQRFFANRGGGPMMARRPGMGGPMMGGVPQSPNGVYGYPPLIAEPLHRPAKLRSFMGLGVITWTGAADHADKQLSVLPQEAFRGERLVVDVVATAAAAGLVLVKLLQVGVQPQQPDTTQPAPASMFAKDVTYGHVDLQVAKPGIEISITLGITTDPGAGETVTAACGLFGEWIR